MSLVKNVFLCSLCSLIFSFGCGEKEEVSEGTQVGDCTDGADNDGDGSFDCDDSGCSGAPDCTETDPVDTGTEPVTEVDSDQDGYPSSVDCNDDDPNSTVMANDADCDGVLTCDDCDDTDASMPNNDSDCDGTLEADDCDDNNPNSTIVSEDGDCDGILTADDCDDSNPNSTIVSTDADCDGILTVDDCDDNDVNVTECEGCSDGTIEGDNTMWNRTDIVYCEYDVDQNSGISLTESSEYCAVGWHVCSAFEYISRNDDFVNTNSGGTSSAITARIDDGDECYVHDDGFENSAHDMNADNVRGAGLSGTCSGTVGGAYSMQGIIEDGLCASPRWCGVVCCQ